MIKTVIEEGIYDIETRESIKKAIFINDGERVTRQLFYKDGLNRDRIDVIKTDTFNFRTSILIQTIIDSKFSNENLIEIFNRKSAEFKDCYQRNIDSELPFFKNPIVTEYAT